MPGARPFDLFDPDRKGRMKLYVKRVFITDDAEILPRYLRFVRGLVDSADLPLNLSREMIQDEPDPRRDQEGRHRPRARRAREARRRATPRPTPRSGTPSAPVLKEGLYEDFERRDALLGAGALQAPPRPASGWRSLKDYVAALKENQTAIYYLAGDDLARLEASPHLEGFRARGVEVLLLSDPVDSFWVTSAPSFDGKPFKSVTQGAADLALIPLLDAKDEPAPETDAAVDATSSPSSSTTLGDAVSRRARLRPADRQRGLPGRVRSRPRPAAGKAARRRRPAQDRAPSRCWRSIRATR